MPATGPISATDEHVITQAAEHVAHHFGIEEITYDFRGMSLSDDDDFEPDVTAEELLTALKDAEKLEAEVPDNVILTHPAFLVQVSPEGDERYAQYDQITDIGDQWNTVFVAIAEAVALRTASNEAMARAIALRQQFGLSNHADAEACPCGDATSHPCPECGVPMHAHYDDEFGHLDLCLNPACPND